MSPSMEALQAEIDSPSHQDAIRKVRARVISSERSLSNGGGDDLKEMGKGISALLASQELMQRSIDILPKRDEVRTMIGAHATTCAAARGEANSVRLKKFGLEVSGRSVTTFLIGLGVVCIVLIVALAQYADDIIDACKGRPAAHSYSRSPVRSPDRATEESP